MRMQRSITVLIVIVCFFEFGQGQKYLQIEKINSTESIKISEGSTLFFIAPIYSDHWQKGIIKEIIYESETIVFDHTIINLKEIKKIKINNGAGNAMAWALKGFGFSWLVTGAIIDLADLNDQNALDAQNILIGALSIGTGVFIGKLGGNKIYTHNKTHRFRLIDLRFSVDE